MTSESRLVSGIVNRAEEHILLVYGDPNEVNPKDFISVALVAPCPGDGFTVQYLLGADDATVKEVQKELRYYLIEKGEPSRWLYAIYHSGTASNWYSRVHWCWQEGKRVRSPS